MVHLPCSPFDCTAIEERCLDLPELALEKSRVNSSNAPGPFAASNIAGLWIVVCVLCFCVSFCLGRKKHKSLSLLHPLDGDSEII